MLAFTLFLLAVALALTVLSIQNVTFSPTVTKYLKTDKSGGEASKYGFSKRLLWKLILTLKVPYYVYIKKLPNYEGAQYMMNTLGKTFPWKLPFRSTEYLITSDPITAKEIMADRSWLHRVPVGFYCQGAGFNMPNGLFFGGGKAWKAANRITVKLLQQLGFFNAVSMEGRFLFEIQQLEKQFELEMATRDGEHTFCPSQTFSYLSMNVVFYILLGKRNPFDEAVVTKLVHCVKKSNRNMSIAWNALEIVPFLRYFPKLTFLKSFYDMSTTVYSTFREVISEKRRVGKYRERMEDFVDGLLQHVDKSGSCEDGLNEENMLVVLRDLIFAGADTTSATVEYGLLYMALHQQVQEKVRAEIHQTIGPDRAPSYEDRRRMPYTQAVLNETYRLGSPVPAVARSTKNSNVWSCALIMLYNIHTNESVYDEPYKFKPERFLSTENPSQVINTSNLIPFGYGRRSCPAETAARVAGFIYFVVMLQKYSIRLSTHHPPPSMRNTNGLARSPRPYYITIAKI